MEEASAIIIQQLPPDSSEVKESPEAVHIEMPNKDDITLLKVPVLLQVPESMQPLIDSKDFEDSNDLSFSRLDNTAIDESVLNSAMLGRVNLEDFVDIVTTYKCKFCRFSCAWKSGLMSHIRNTHIARRVSNRDCEASSVNVSNSLSSSSHMYSSHQPLMPSIPLVSMSENMDNAVISLREPQIQSFPMQDHSQPKSEQELQKSNLITNPPNQVVPPMPEKQIFLCGSCHQGFDTLEFCKDHIVKEHQLKFEVGENSKRKKRGKPKRKRPGYENENNMRERLKNQKPESENEDFIETLSKRKVRPPRALSSDYYLLTRKRKYTRRQGAKDKTFRCEVKGCSQHFLSEDNLNYHTQCHKEDERVFQCLECFEKCEHWRSMTIHLWKYHQIDLDLYACTDCDYRTYSLFKLDNHRRIHSDERAFTCNICSKGFKQMSQLRNHQVIHVDRKNMIEKRWFSEQRCDICSRTFSDSKCLRKHMQAVHNKVKPFVCTFCGHTSARKAMLQLHLRQHTGEKPFKCDLCEYQTGDHNSLRRHKMRHSGIKPYKCPHCSYACIQAISYKTHMKNKHPGMDGLFCCNLCSFRSVSRDNYENHMSDHQRGVIPAKATAASPKEVATLPVQSEGPPLDLSAAVPSISQLEGVIPGNLATAQLIYNCLSALSNAGSSSLPSGVASSNTQNNPQTITIQVPCVQSSVDGDQFYLTIHQPEAPVGSHITEIEEAVGSHFTLDSAVNEGIHLAVESDPADVASDCLNKVELMSNDIIYATDENAHVNIGVSDITNLPLLTVESN